MRGLSILQNRTQKVSNIKEEYQFLINDMNIRYGLVELESPNFNSSEHSDFVLVQKMAFSLNYRDLALAIMIQKQLDSANPKEGLNYAIGSDFSGVIVDKGKNVENFEIGDRVIPNSNYPYSEYPNILPGIPTNQGSKEFEILHKSKLAKIPDEMSFVEGAAFTIGFQTVYSMIDRLNIEHGAKVLITAGTSNTSLFAINTLLNQGNRNIVVLVRSDIAKQRIAEMGWDIKCIVVNPDTEKSLMENREINSCVNNTGGFQYVIDPFIDSNLVKVIPSIAMNGKYITCGISDQFNGDSRLNLPPLLFGILIMKNVSIIGNCLGTSQHLYAAIKDFSLNKLQVPIKAVLNTDLGSFIEKSFTKVDGIGKVVFHY